MNNLTELFHNPLFERIREYFVQHSYKDGTIFLFVPYIKTTVLDKLLNGMRNNIVVVTTWNPWDILTGSSDLSLYPYCKERRIALYVSEDMHLKVYSVGLESAILATGNVSNRGLMPGGNYEAGIMVKHLTASDRLFFEKIRRDARLVNDTLHENLKKWIENSEVSLPERTTLNDIIPVSMHDDFLTSALPMTRSVDDLIRGYVRIASGMDPSNDSETSACIFHDLANYKIDVGLTEEEFLNELTIKFFAHPFVKKIDKFIAPDAYFGRIKEWIQSNCTDVPLPSRRKLTGNVQVLLEWFVKLGNGTYCVDVPGSHSQRIYKV